MYKKWIEGKKVVCFDLDGTIVDSVGPAVQAFANILRLASPDLRIGDVYGKVGEPLYEKWAKLADAKLLKNNVSVRDLTDNTNNEYLKIVSSLPLEPRPGFWDLVYKLKEDKGLLLALATNSIKNVALQVMNKLEIGGIFDFMIFGDEVKRPKPNPEIYDKTAKHFNIKPQEMLVFEDSILGAQAASIAGASLVVIWDGQTMKSLFPKEALAFTPDFVGIAENLDYTIDESLANLKKASERVSGGQTQQTL